MNKQEMKKLQAQGYKKVPAYFLGKGYFIFCIICFALSLLYAKIFYSAFSSTSFCVYYAATVVITLFIFIAFLRDHYRQRQLNKILKTSPYRMIDKNGQFSIVYLVGQMTIEELQNKGIIFIAPQK